MPKKATYLEKICTAIRALKDPKGSSRAAIKAYISKNFENSDNANALKKALKDGVKKKKLENGESSQRFKISGESYKAKDDGFRMKDVTSGDAGGNVAKVGDRVVVKYKGTLQSDGYVFDQANRFEFVLGAGDVIKGWDRGIVGMVVGMKRELVCPPHLAYGKRGCAPDIPGNSNLCFTVTLKAIK